MAVRKNGSNKRNNGRQKPLDELGAQVFAVKTLDPDASVRKIAQQIGVSYSAVWRRVKNIESADWYKKAVAQFQELVPLALANYAARIRAGDSAAAHDVMFGLGVLRNKHDHNVSGNIGLEHQGDPLFSGIERDKLRALADALKDGIGEIGYTPPLVGEDVPPDGEGPAD